MNADLRQENAWKYYKYAEIMEGIVPLSPTSTIPALLLTLFSMFLVLYTKSFPSQHGTETDTMYTQKERELGPVYVWVYVCLCVYV